MFSSRLPPRLQPTEASRAVWRARTAGLVRFDLTEANPTVVGLSYPTSVVSAFGHAAAVRYDPQAMGDAAAREAVARTCLPLTVSAEHVMLTASTSEAYSFLFKLLCDPGDEVLVPQPSYPLFDLLTGLDAVRPVPYRLDPAGGWCLDRGSLEHGATEATRAVLVVSPNNPTGSMLRRGDREWLVAWAGGHGCALIADEVFAGYPLAPVSDATSLLGEARVLTFTLGGLSKSAGLPQMKLGWTVVSGPAPLVADALARLELIADSYLSVSTPVQLAAPALIAAGREVRIAIHERIRHNLEVLRRAVLAAPALTLYEPDGGWSAVLRVPAMLSEEQWVQRLIDTGGVLVHPGYFFDIETGVHLVISLLPQPDIFDAGVSRLVVLVRELAS